MARWVGEKMPKAKAKEISGIENIMFLEEFEEIFGRLWIEQK